MKATFVTREFGKNPADITREEFIKMAIEDVEKAKVRLSKLSDDNKGTYVELEASQDIPLHGEFRLDATIADRRFSVSVPVVITP